MTCEFFFTSSHVFGAVKPGPVPVKWILKNNNATVSWIYHQVDLTGDFLRYLIVFLVV